MLPKDKFVEESFHHLLSLAKENGLSYEGQFYMDLVCLLKDNDIITERDLSGHMFFLMDKTMDLPDRDVYWNLPK